MSTLPRVDTDQLVYAYRSYAEALAAEMLRKLPAHIEKSDIVAAAELGLVEAARAFDPARGVLFKTFAFYRIRGAIYDCLRKMAWFSRTQYQHYRFEQAANEYMADYASTSVPQGSLQEQHDELKNIGGSIVNCYMLSLNQLPEKATERLPSEGEEECDRLEQQQMLRECLDQLPEKNRQVLELYYFQDVNMEEIGERLGLSKSWVSRIHSRSLDMIRDRINSKNSTKM